jgi:hypothetical protein
MAECTDGEIVVCLRVCGGTETRLERSAKSGRDLAAEHCCGDFGAMCCGGVCDCDAK